MNNAAKIGSQLLSLDVENVYIYVGDAVRYDHLNPHIAEMGISVQTIASSIHSPSSFASLATGRYPPRHGVSSFSERVAESVDTFLDLDDYHTDFINSIFEYAAEEHGQNSDPIHDVLRSPPSSDRDSLEQIASPFILMERGPGGHAPYGDFDGTASDYFRQVASADRDRIKRDYQRSIDLDTELFERRIRTLADRGLLNDTLVVYTSDHGELLGEGGLLGHNGPMLPELVYVPTVFIHDNVPTATLDTTYHHVDLLPTIYDIINVQVEPTQMDGESLSNAVTSPRPCFWTNRFFTTDLPVIDGKLGYEGVWDTTGGRVYSDTSLINRLTVLVGKMLMSSKREYMRRHGVACLRSYLWQSRTYGEPRFTDGEAHEILERTKSKAIDAGSTELTDKARSHLRNLGYLN